jgi:hypothetical protein
MILGMTLSVFIHVVLSLIGIAAGIVVLAALLVSRKAPGWTALFLSTTILTSVTGFFLPAKMVLPSHIVGIISLVLLAIALFAYYGRRLAASWRWMYVVTAMLALYLNVFVLIIQSFLKIPTLKMLAPTQTELPFVAVQGLVLAAFGVFTVLAAMRFRPSPISTV